MLRHTITAVVAGWLVVGAAFGAGITPDSYNTPNGYTGSYNYWDQIYSGSGCVTCDGAALTGGKGDLTDGIIAVNNWFTDEAPPGNGPYVGWLIDPTITFHWNSAVNISSVTFYLDDSNGNGGVSAPGSITVDGINFTVPEPIGSAPFAFTASGLSFSGTDLVVTLHRKAGWVFLSEVETNALDPNAVPEPASSALLFVGLGLLGFAARRKKQ
jgi:hypothetical protein